MSEVAKTIVFLVGGVAAASAAWFSAASQTATKPPEKHTLFEEFQDPFAAKSMEVVEFDNELGEMSSFKIAQKQGLWVIPSHSDYPADARDNLKEAATLLINLDVVAVASDSLSDHELYGVVEPNPDKASLGDKGIGKLIQFKDETGSRLASLIVGKAVEGRDGQRFVRVPGQDRVYVVKIDPDKVSTDFQDWIESDLLQLNAFDITEMTIRDYSVQEARTRSGQLAIIPEERLTMRVSWNAQDFNWNLEEFKEFVGEELRESQLLENEELNKTALDGMKSALDDLKIADVERKPAGLKADLTASDNFGQDNENLQSLADAGFYPVPMPDGGLQLMSSDGEVFIKTKENVIYTLRFGRVSGVQAEAGSDAKLERFVMVTASSEPIAEPELEAIPGAQPDGEKPADSQAADSQAADSNAADSEAAEGEAAEGEAAEGEAAEGKAAEGEGAAAEAAETESGEAPADSTDERDRILKENQRKLDEYKEKVKKTTDKVAELNARFAPWYYVVSEDVYKKIHLGRPDIIKAKESTAKEGTSLKSFRALEQDGLKRDDDK